MSVTIKEVQYGAYGKCVSMSNGIVELLVTVDVGPRIIYLGTVGGPNMFGELGYDKDAADTFQLMGGHRLWHSPEAMPRSYEVDNSPVYWEEYEGGIRTVQKPESWAQTQKEMEIYMEDNSPLITVMHRIRNCGAWPVKLSAWSISIMSKGGLEIVPMTQRDTGLLGNRVLGLWPYSNMADKRVMWGKRYVALRQDENADTAFKFGINGEEGWGAYFNHGQLFIKQHYHDMEETYPDGGMSYETYTDNRFLEMESLSPMTELQPDETVEHLEYWALIPDVEEPALDEDAFDEIMGPLMEPVDGGCGCGCDDCDGDCDGDCDCGDDDCDCGGHHHHHH